MYLVEEPNILTGGLFQLCINSTDVFTFFKNYEISVENANISKYLYNSLIIIRI